MAIDDDAAPAACASSSAAPTAPGSRPCQRRHRVVQMGEAAHSGVDAPRALSVAGAVWPAATITPRRLTRGSSPTDTLRRQCHQGEALQGGGQRDCPARPARGTCWHRAMPLRAGSRNGPSRWMPSTPGTPCAIAIASGVDRLAHDRRVVADQRRQQAGGAEAAMRRADAPHALDGRWSLNSTPPPPLTWQSMNPGSKVALADRACARVSLPVAVVTTGYARRRSPPPDLLDPAIGQHAAIDQGKAAHTRFGDLAQMRRTSGSSPRRSASALIAR